MDNVGLAILIVFIAILLLPMGIAYFLRRKQESDNRQIKDVNARFFMPVAGVIAEFKIYHFLMKFDRKTNALQVHVDTDRITEFESAVRGKLDAQESKPVLTITRLSGPPPGPTDTPGTRTCGWKGDVMSWNTDRGEQYIARGCRHGH